MKLDILKELFSEDRDWEQIIVDLTIYAQKRLSYIIWNTGHRQAPNVLLAEDFVHEAIIAICTGKRRQLRGR